MGDTAQHHLQKNVNFVNFEERITGGGKEDSFKNITLLDEHPVDWSTRSEKENDSYKTHCREGLPGIDRGNSEFNWSQWISFK